MTVADRIKKARTDANLSQTRLGQLIGVTQTAIANYEKGYREPTIIHLVKLSAVLGVTVDWLCESEYADVTDEDKLVSMYRSLNDDGKRCLMLQAEFFASRTEYKKAFAESEAI